MASYQALSNAAEMIRSHGEEGFSYEDKKLFSSYQKASRKLCKQLNSRAMKFLNRYKELGIEVDTEIDQNY